MSKKKCDKHYYILESPNGGLSKGICKWCKHEKVHYNSRDGWTLQQRKNITLNAQAGRNYFNPRLGDRF